MMNGQRSEMKKPTVYIFMNKGLGMSPGKLAAQSAHAMRNVTTEIEKLDKYRTKPFTILIMEARDQQHLENITSYLYKMGVKSGLYYDEGVNETEPDVVTALATQVVDKDLPEVQELFGHFKLYRELITFTGKIER
jgi:peptidyl-tRNA hydrolase